MPELWISIRERKNRPGKWLVDYIVDGQRHTATFSSYELASAAAKELRAAHRRGELNAEPKRGVRTLEELTTDFLGQKQREGLSPDTLATYRSLLERTVVPRLGCKLAPSRVTQQLVEEYRDARLREVTATTVYREVDRLRALLGHAKALGLVQRNVVELVKLPKLREEPKDWLRSPEVRPFLLACTGEFLNIARFTIFTGLRRREVVFLQRSDIDLQNGVVSVRAKPHAGFRPKNGQERSVPLDPTVRPFIERQLEELPPGAGQWLFPQRDGSRRSGSTRWFAVSTQRAAERAGINRPLTFHDLRRTYGAMLIEAGVGIYEVSRLLGHSDVRITQRVYAPICGRFLAQEVAKLGRYLGHALEAPTPAVPALRPVVA